MGTSVHRLHTTQESACRKSQRRPKANIRGVLVEALLAILLSKSRRPARQPRAALRELQNVNILKRQTCTAL